MSSIVSEKKLPEDTPTPVNSGDAYITQAAALAAILDDDQEAAEYQVHALTFPEIRALSAATRRLGQLCRDVFAARIWASIGDHDDA
jgi:hypothetical protein